MSRGPWKKALDCSGKSGHITLRIGLGYRVISVTVKWGQVILRGAVGFSGIRVARYEFHFEYW